MLEVACFNPQSVITAIACGAHRIELCSSPAEGGLTPSDGFIDFALSIAGSIPVHVMLRCREGHFVFSDYEKSIMLHDIERIAQTNVSGIVCGALTEAAMPDTPFLRELMFRGNGKKMVFHRAIDVCGDTEKAIKELIDLQFSEILSSGTKPSAIEGIKELQQMKNVAKGKIQIMAGAGIHSGNLKELMQAQCANNFHLSAIRKGEQEYFLRGINSFTLQSAYNTDETELKKCLTIFEEFFGEKTPG